MLAYILDLGVQFLEGQQHLAGDLPRQLDIGVLGHEQRDQQVLIVREVDEVLVVVEIDDLHLRVGLGLHAKGGTFWRLPLVWLSALMRSVVVWMNFSCCYFFSCGEKLLQMWRPSSSDRITPLIAKNSSTIFLRNSVLYPPILLYTYGFVDN